MKIIALGFKGFLRDKMNILDSMIIVVAILELQF
jgi:hypothetical protein